MSPAGVVFDFDREIFVGLYAGAQFSLRCDDCVIHHVSLIGLKFTFGTLLGIGANISSMAKVAGLLRSRGDSVRWAFDP
jgi:hypothetical protein